MGLMLFLLATGIAFIQDRGQFLYAEREYRPVRSPLFWVSLAYLWLLLRASYHGLDTVGQSMSGYVATAACVLAVVVIVGDKARRGYLVKGFVAVVFAVSLSYVCTVGLWAVMGIGTGSVGTMIIGAWPTPQPIYFPFTTTVSTQPILGFVVPRFVGFGREPGWMAMYGCVAYFLLPLIGWRSKIVKLGILAGVLGTVSTAGFGVLAFCLAVDFTVNGRSRTSFEGAMRICFGLAMIAFAIWAAVYAPVLGFGAKGEQNGISLSERSIATDMGFWALQNDPFSGGLAADKVGAVNLVAAIAAYGLPFSVLMGLSTIAPLRRHPHGRRLLPVLAALALTLLTSQPALDSAWVFALAALGTAAALDPAEIPQKEPLLAAKKSNVPDHYKRLAEQRARAAATNC
ncbi:hypothetical protein ARGLB_064_01140 [Arthrobacter globiformis NBRC 12137]|uniref:O-antigen polymerase family protein n=1 Tax=Arthrobacter globiformis (strain ATCC 8010 / DSM 20124 / JCM 1332 / NBRC 12137 / NCIMB 8907 / NRRL B-2979 / 168) TaxID=1077972 RepID=H0QNF0_ARTG1|nr:hypothetical protein ARGLB_064_01140 [Arthrobacter globiformis NBRC 12137]